MTRDGVITTVAGTGVGGFSGDGGPATSAQLFSPTALAFDGTGNLYVADTGNNRIRRIGTDGRITTVAGNGVQDQSPDGTPALEAALNVPVGVAVGPSGRLYIVEEDRVLTIAGDGTIRTVAGALYSSGYNGDNVAASSALLDSPTGIAVDGAGDVYISDTDNQRVRKIGHCSGLSAIRSTARSTSSRNACSKSGFRWRTTGKRLRIPASPTGERGP